MGKLKFKILKKKGNARVGQINLNGVKLTTPVFMPVGTKATIKGLILDLLKDKKYIGDPTPIKLILANTFHLFLRPGDELIKKFGGLHKFENWDGLILTDSGGFQVFSLGLNKRGRTKDQGIEVNGNDTFLHDVKLKLTEEGIHFCSPYDGSKHFFSPEKVVDIQCNLGSDIMMVLDVCSPSNSDKDTINDQMQMTHRWAKRAFDYFEKKYDKSRGVLFPIVQGGIYKDLRLESIEFLSKYAWDGIAVGGVSVGESKDLIQEVVKFTGKKLPENKPRYLMGVGTPEDIMYAVKQGFDMFDCVLPTRLGRHGIAFSDQGNMKLNNAKYKSDFGNLTKNCGCFVCKNFTKAYINHLLKENEMLGGVLLSLHNISYLHSMLEKWKKKLISGN
ncbi:MAG: tRNA guanosine(34) transglycosylase Tgt [Candidatus Absconditabacterales bacterium]